MKVNLPVTEKEHHYDASLKLVSTTDTKGIITHANHDFWEVSGFHDKELLHHNHNMIRHPDVPPAVFKELWATIKTGEPWGGVVKNRCKNGDHYWVYASVTAVYSNGELIGYQSVRTCPTREQIEEAEKQYAAMWAEIGIDKIR